MNNRQLFAAAAVATVAAFVLCGCRIDEGREVAQYRQVLDEHAAPTTAPSASSATLSLQPALQLANRNSETLASAGEDYLQAIIAKNRAAASFLPTLSVAPSYSISDIGGGRTSDTTSVTANGSMNVFNGFQDLANLNKAKLTIQQRRELLLDQQATLLLNVVQVYYQVLRDERQVNVYRASISYQEERVRDTEARVRLGAAKPLDLAQSRADLAATRVSLTQAIADTRNGRTTLAYLIGTPEAAFELRDDLSLPQRTGGVDEYLAQAAASRRDLLAAGHAVDAAMQGTKAAFGQYYPSVSVDANYLLFRDPSVAGDWNAGISANVPLFTAGRIHEDVRAAWSQYRQAALAESNLRRQITQEVRQAYETLLATGAKLKDLDDEVSSARDSLTLAERSYQLGNATNLDRLSAQDSLVKAQLQQVSEQLNEKVSYLELLRRTGRLDLTTLAPASGRPIP